MATPPQGRKMAPEKPFPSLIETGKSYPKTGFCRRFCRQVQPGFPDSGFASGLPAVFRRFDGYTGPVDIRLLPSVPSSVLRLSGLA